MFPKTILIFVVVGCIFFAATIDVVVADVIVILQDIRNGLWYSAKWTTINVCCRRGLHRFGHTIGVISWRWLLCMHQTCKKSLNEYRAGGRNAEAMAQCTTGSWERVTAEHDEGDEQYPTYITTIFVVIPAKHTLTCTQSMRDLRSCSAFHSASQISIYV